MELMGKIKGLKDYEVPDELIQELLSLCESWEALLIDRAYNSAMDDMMQDDFL